LKPVRTLFWDIGGVLLSNAWDHEERGRAIERFHLSKEDFEARHKENVSRLEEGKLSLDEYLSRTVFQKARSFTREEFKAYMFSLSKPKTEVLEFVRSLANTCVMATINNESRELNEFRISQFGLTQIFHLFVSSCYVGVRKPDGRIYKLALDLIQKSPEECCFIDDRPMNIEGAKNIGMRTILMQGLAQLKADLMGLGIQTGL
jgi:putative hydrolase of the HAD superfamily